MEKSEASNKKSYIFLLKHVCYLGSTTYNFTQNKFVFSFFFLQIILNRYIVHILWCNRLEWLSNLTFMNP